ncbi:MAG: hypothetical protein HGA96_17430 [Desulfobulbaceae bacterium]|nr:hypothetical protein [Desulfobulbaceae bacterium]
MKWCARLALAVGVLLTPVAASAWELAGFASLGAGQATYPAVPQVYSTREDFPWLGNFRILAEEGSGSLHFTANVLEAAGTLPPLTVTATGASPKEVERSNLLTWEQHDSAASRVSLSVDALALQYRGRTLDVTVGRQPVSLATTFYYAPNDFFAAFAPQSFFRTYRPGVDGIRADLRLESLAQIRLLAVMAYGADADSANGWSRGPEWSRTALLAGYNWEWRGFGWSFLGGTVADRTLLGGGLQGELFDWLGIRAEGHYAVAEQAGAGKGGRFALGVEHRYAAGLDWRLEYYYQDNLTPALPLQNRHYGALSLGYQFSPLTTGGLVLLAALNDGSQLFSANLLYSLSDEAELALTGVVPQGRRPVGSYDPGPEFARQPRQLLLEYRVYF